VETKIIEHMKFLNGWQITINSLLQLWENVQTPQYVLFTYRLKDCLENLFGNFRNQNGNNVNPTPIQFLWAFKNLFFLNYFKHSEGSNCLEYLDEILTNLGDTTSPLSNAVLFLEKSPFNYSYLKTGTTDYIELDLTPRNALTYVWGYLLKKKCLGKHTCEVCRSFSKSQYYLDESFIFTHLKAYQNYQPTNFGNLNVPPDSFFNYINELDNIFITNFPTHRL